MLGLKERLLLSLPDNECWEASAIAMKELLILQIIIRVDL